jgi:hypothetical protein
MTKYPEETLNDDIDDGTMPGNVDELREAVVGHRIVKAERSEPKVNGWGCVVAAPLVITLDNGKQVQLEDTGECCAHTELSRFLLHPERVDHIITGVGTTDEYTTWHIYADMGDVLQLDLSWGMGTGYYAYGFNITVTDVEGI